MFRVLINHKKFIICIIILAMMPTMVYARSFTDVKKDYWAYDYIEKMNKNKIITGYPDATFRPNDRVTTVQSLVMLSRILDISDNEAKIIQDRYNEFLNSIGVDNWAKKGIAIAIDRDIISKEAVKEIYTKDKGKFAKKYEICVYITKAMGLEEKARENKIIILPFKDTENIPVKSRKYVKMMLDIGVLNEQGSGDGKFNPDTSLTRAIIAKILSVAVDYLNENKEIDMEENIVNDSNKDTYSVHGNIIKIYNISDNLFLNIDDDGKDKVYRIEDDAKIKIDGDISKVSDLIVGLKVELEVDDTKKIISVNGETIEDEYEGYVYNIGKKENKITIEYEKGNDDIKKTFVVDSDADIELDNVDVKLKDIDEGDYVEIQVKKSKIVDIEGIREDKDVEGYITEIEIEDNPSVIIKNKDGQENKYYILDDVYVERNDKKVRVETLRVGDQVELKLKYNKVKSIEAEATEEDNEGIIKSINISELSQITIIDKDDKKVTYDLPKDATIEIDDDLESIYDLRNGYYVELEVESGKVRKLEAESRDHGERYIGIIDDISVRKEKIELYIQSPKYRKGEYIIIIFDEDTNFIGLDGKRMRPKTLDDDDKIEVIGEYYKGQFVANTVILSEKGN
ncbi:S-layer homology domain-containing protein [Dethiothermospora halolimnae]|uniref:S-layer homology domain-containing protein n=1 Tax=Dethiothermospora halolimnae TaxID=3114390 RepID=UPI003CCC1A04